MSSSMTKTTPLGLLLVGTGSIGLLGFLFIAFISKRLPPSDRSELDPNPLFAAILNDRYYSYLVPLTLPVLMVAVYFHWLSMKLFRHA